MRKLRLRHLKDALRDKRFIFRDQLQKRRYENAFFFKLFFNPSWKYVHGSLCFYHAV